LGLGLDDEGRRIPPGRTTVRPPARRRSLVALLKATPRTSGWCRPRWSGATLALTVQAQRGMTVSAETRRRWLHEIGWVWKRAKRMANDDDPQRVNRLARIRWVFEPLKPCEAMVCADERESHLWPKVGCAWRPQGTQLAVMTPGQHQQHDLAGALDLAPGIRLHGWGARNTKVRCRALLEILEASYPAERSTRLYVVVENDKIHQAKAVQQWLASHPRVTRLLLPTYGPRANPIERAFGDVHDGCTRHPRCQRVPDLVADGEAHLHVHGPWPCTLSKIDYEPAVTAAVEKIAAEEHTKVAA
jgi:hypothetical protein